MVELKEYWNIEAKLESQSHLKYDKKLIIVIKNHSPHLRKFRIKLIKHEFSDPQNALHFMMFSGLNTSIFIEVEKYKKRSVEIDLPKLINPEDKGKLYFEIENIDTKETKTLVVKL